MATKPTLVEDEQRAAIADERAGAEARAARRKIPGNLPYTTSSGVFKSVLQKIPIVERPSVFTTDFLSTVLGATGGAARPIIPILKSTGFLSQTGAPTDLYAAFQTDSGRPGATLQALKNGFGEVFRRNQYAHKLEANGLNDLIVAVTGLPRNDKVLGAIRNTFQTLQDFARAAPDEVTPPQRTESQTLDLQAQPTVDQRNERSPIGLAYNINIALPETTNIEVYNSIFKSLKANLL